MNLLNARMIDDDIHPESQFEKQYSKTEISAEDFPGKKKNLYVKTPNIDLSKVKNEVIYKLYNDNNELLQTENVPVLKDGTSISEVTELYIRTATPEKPSKDAAGWSVNVPIFTGNNKYLWNYEKIKDTRGNAISETEPVLLDESGKQIDYLEEEYAVTTTQTPPAESAWTSTVPALSDTNKFLWNREKVHYINIAAAVVTRCSIIGVYGDKGDKGKDGKQGGSYKGPLAVEPSTAVNGDFFLDTSNQTVKYFDGVNWIEDPLDETNLSWRWNTAIQDVISVAGSSGNFYKASNIWVDKLLANTIIADKIKAKSGFFGNITVTGESKFEGTLTAAVYNHLGMMFQDVAFITICKTQAGDTYQNEYKDRWYLSPIKCSSNVVAMQHISTGLFIVYLKNINPLPNLETFALMVSSYATSYERDINYGEQSTKICNITLGDLSSSKMEVAADGKYDIISVSLKSIMNYETYLHKEAGVTKYINLRDSLPRLSVIKDEKMRYYGYYPLVIGVSNYKGELVDPIGGLTLVLRGFNNVTVSAWQPPMFTK